MNLLFVGDVMLGRLVNHALRTRPPEYPWGDTLPLLHSADWRMCNLECVISRKGTPWTATPKVFHFRSDPANVRALQTARFNPVSIANNHALDYGYDAFLEMLDIFKREGIQYAGAGRNWAEAARPVVTKAGNLSIAVVAFTDNEPQWEAEAGKPGTFYAPIHPSDRRMQRVLDAVEKAKQQADLVVVSTHWGPNWGYAPLASHRRVGRALIEAGADIVHGHSGHIVRGIELYHGRPILYSSGDFVDDYAVNPQERNDESFIFIVRTEGTAIRELLLHPTVIAEFQARMPAPEHGQAIASKMQELCRNLGTRSIWNKQKMHLQIAVS